MEPPWRANWAPIYIFLIEFIVNPVFATKVYLDRYGDCSRGTYFPVNANDEFTILSHGGEAFDTLRCEITFKSEADDRLCLHFRNFFISRCDVKLEVYPEQSASGKVLGTYSCHTADIPSSLCSEERYLTVLFHKRELGHDGYDFSMELREMTQSDAFRQGFDAFFLSIGVIIAIVVGVIVLVVISAVAIICCCCTKRHKGLVYRQTRNGDAFRQGFDAFFLSIGVIIAIVVGVIVLVVISAVAIICCCCTKRHKGLVYRQTRKSTANGPGQDGGPVEPSAPPYPTDDAPPTYSEPPPPYSSSQEVPSPTAPPADKAYV